MRKTKYETYQKKAYSLIHRTAPLIEEGIGSMVDYQTYVMDDISTRYEKTCLGRMIKRVHLLRSDLESYGMTGTLMETVLELDLYEDWLHNRLNHLNQEN